MYLFLDNPGHFISSLAIFTGVNFKHEDDKYLNYIEKSTMYYVSAPISTQAKHKTTLCNSVMDANANELLGVGIRDGRLLRTACSSYPFISFYINCLHFKHISRWPNQTGIKNACHKNMFLFCYQGIYSIAVAWFQYIIPRNTSRSYCDLLLHESA